MSDLQKQAEEFGVPFVKTMTSEQFDSGLIAALPVTWAREHNVLPIRIEGVASLLMAGPDGMSALQHASLVVGEDLQPAFAEKTVLTAAIEQAYYQGKSTTLAGSPSKSSHASTFEATPARNGRIELRQGSLENDLLVDREAQPITQYLNNVILEAVRRDASDVHLEPTDEGSLRVRFRLDGILHEQPMPPAGYAAPLVSRVKVMAGMDIAERRLPQDGMAQVRMGGKIVDIRVSTVPVAEGERVVLRILNRDRSLLPLAALGMPAEVLKGVESLLDFPNGMVIVSGPTGSGKTTTLYSALGTLDSQRRNILTIEDPVEYRLPSIGQIQVKPKIGLTFASGLRHILRQDPDVVLVGETRDAETAEIAIRASLTGHLVFTTLHTNDAPSAMMRLVDMGIEPYLLASCLRGVLAQRLVRQLCPHCAQFWPLSDPRVGDLEREGIRALGGQQVPHAMGCSQCLEGYTGRIGIFEYLACVPSVVEAIHRGNLAAETIREVAEAAGSYCSMRMDAAAKLCAGQTTYAEIVAALGF